MPGAAILRTMAATFRALADPTRLQIVRLLADRGEVFQKKLVHEIGANQSSVSRHLAYLQRAGLVAERRTGRYVYLVLGRLPDPVVDLLRHLGPFSPSDQQVRLRGPAFRAGAPD